MMNFMKSHRKFTMKETFHILLRVLLSLRILIIKKSVFIQLEMLVDTFGVGKSIVGGD